MKEALYQQELKISGLKCNSTCSKLKKSITQADIEPVEGTEEKSSNEELEAPVKFDNLDWIMRESEEVDFF
jgi:hypothetical protein